MGSPARTVRLKAACCFWTNLRRPGAITRENLQEWLLSVLERFHRAVLFVTHSIDEAIYLADRVYLISQRPGELSWNSPLSAPPPLRGIITTAPFLNYKELLMKSLQSKLSQGASCRLQPV